MGSLLSIQKDVRQMIFKQYLNSYDQMMLLWSVGVKSKITHDFFNYAVFNGYTNIMDWVDNNTTDVSGWIMPRYTNSDLIIGRTAIRGGHIDALDWIYDNYPRGIIGRYHPYTGQHAKLNVIKWVLSKNNKLDDFRKIASAAVRGDRLEVLIWIKEEYPQKWRDIEDQIDNMISLAVLQNSLETFKWFELNYRYKINTLMYHALLRR